MCLRVPGVPLGAETVSVPSTHLVSPRRGALWHCRRVIQESGYRGFYAGLMPVMLRAFPANACQWLTWELVMRYVDPDYR